MPTARKLPEREGGVIQRRLSALINTEYDGNITTAAEAIGVPNNQLWAACTGRVRKPNPALLLAVAAHFQVAVEELCR